MAVVAHALIGGITWPVALALGAIVAPSDSIAAAAIVAPLAVPRRIVTLLEGESLLNDATALTIYREHREIRRTVIDSEREALLRLRAGGAIDDDVMRSLERELDLEEQRMDA